MRLLVKPSTSLKLVCGRKLVARAVEQSVKSFWEVFVVLLCIVFFVVTQRRMFLELSSYFLYKLHRAYYIYVLYKYTRFFV